MDCWRRGCCTLLKVMVLVLCMAMHCHHHHHHQRNAPVVKVALAPGCVEPGDGCCHDTQNAASDSTTIVTTIHVIIHKTTIISYSWPCSCIPVVVCPITVVIAAVILALEADVMLLPNNCHRGD